MATRRKPPVEDAISKTFEERNLKQAPPEPEQENLKAKTFMMKDSEYELLKEYFDKEMGMKIGQGIRYVLHQYIKENIR